MDPAEGRAKGMDVGAEQWGDVEKKGTQEQGSRWEFVL
jgi:hypothetical protein